MPTYRLDILRTLARQLAFAPLDIREAQLAHAETLLNDLDPAKSYPSDFVVFRVTGYQPKTRVQGELLTGLALQHDLGVLIESVSEGMDLRTDAISEPVLSIDDVTARFNVTSKTIQRWRRKGLVSRRFTFGDGKSRVGFLLSSIERFIHRHSDAVKSGSNLTTIEAIELDSIVRNARRLAKAGLSEGELTRRLARRFRRSALTILHTLRKHDQMSPREAILPTLREELSPLRQVRLVRAAHRGATLSMLARRTGISRASIYRVLLDDRIDRLSRRRATFHDDELYHGPDAERDIEAIVHAGDLATPAKEDVRVPPRLPPYVADLYRTPLLNPQQERALFLQFNYRKFKFVTARRVFDPELARHRDLAALEALARSANEVKNRIVAANLRLVVSVARRHVGPTERGGSPTLMELVSEGNVILMRAAESFDIHKNVRFSTYATFALMKGFARLVPELRSKVRRGGVDVTALELPDRREPHAADRLDVRDEVSRLLGVLSPVERRVIAAQYGLDAGRGATDEIALSKHRFKQVEQNAIEKLRAASATMRV